MSHINRHRCAVGTADSTLDVCLLECRERANPPDPTKAEAVRTRPRHAGAHKRPKRPVRLLTSPLLAPPAHSIGLPIHISQVPRG